MKKYTILSIAAVVAMAMLFSCSKVQEEDAPETNDLVEVTKVPLRLQANSHETKTSLEYETGEETGRVLWNQYDEISVFDGTGNCEFTTDITSESASAIFEGTVEDGSTDFAAMYPYTSTATYVPSTKTITTVLKKEQIATVNSFDKSANICVAYATTADASQVYVDGTDALLSMSFANVAGLVKFTIAQNNVHKSVTIKTTDDATLAGSVNIVANTGVASAAATGNESCVVVKAAGEGYLAAGTYYAVALPFSDKTVSLTFNNGIKSKTRRSQETISLERAAIRDLGTIDTGLDYLPGDYIIVGKPTSSGYWQVMSSTIDANGRWAQVSTTISYNTAIDITDSSVDFPGYSINTYRFIVEKYDGGYVLKNYTSGNYVTYAGSGNAGAEVAPASKEKFDAFTVDASGVVSMKVNVSSDYYSLRYSSANSWFTFYKNGNQQAAYLIPYVYVAPAHNLDVSETTITLDGAAGQYIDVDVTSNYAWTAEIATGSGFSIDPDSGSGDDTIRVTASNDGGIDEVTLGTFTVTDGTIVKTVTVKQSAAAAHSITANSATDPTITLNGNHIKPTVLTISSAYSPWSVKSVSGNTPDDGFTYSADVPNNKLTITPKADNTTGAKRTSIGTIILTDPSGDDLCTITLDQATKVTGSLTITRSSFSGSNGTDYNDKAWSADDSNSNTVSGKGTIQKTDASSFGMKNNHPALRNTTALASGISSIKISRTGTNREVTIYASNTALDDSNYSSATSLGSKSVNSDSGVTWTLTDAQKAADYKYFYIYGSGNRLLVTSIVINYE